MVGDCGCRIWNGVLYQSLPMSTDTDGDYTIRTAANCDAIVLPCVDVGVTSSSVDGTTRMAMAAVSNISGTAHTCFCSIHLGVCFRSPNVGDLWYSTTDSGVCCNANVKAIENDEQTHAPKSTTVRYFNGSLTFVDIGDVGRSVFESILTMPDTPQTIRLDDASIVKLAFVLLEGQKLIAEKEEHGGTLVRKLTELVDRINAMPHFS